MKMVCLGGQRIDGRDGFGETVECGNMGCSGCGGD